MYCGGLKGGKPTFIDWGVKEIEILWKKDRQN